MARRYLRDLDKLRGAARRFIAQRPATEGSGLDRSVRYFGKKTLHGRRVSVEPLWQVPLR
jgi:hypothetical protein